MSEGQHRKRRPAKRSCVFCRRSHVNCDEERPCQRCIRRNIAHLCADTPPQTPADSVTPSGTMGSMGSMGLGMGMGAGDSGNIATNLLVPQTFVSENMGSEFSSLNEFLSMLEEPVSMLGVGPNESFPAREDPMTTMNVGNHNNGNYSQMSPALSDGASRQSSNNSLAHSEQQGVVQPPPTAKEQFFLTAADPNVEITPEEKLKSVINAKLEAGLLKPYNYAAGYTRLQAYMNEHMSAESQRRVLQPLNSIRPAFRSIARSLKDVDLVLVEEGFERMLLSYDRVFTSMSMPACLWRRTGEIYRANKEFASLAGVTVDDLRDGRLAIYELMTEQSAVNFWEKYGSIAFDKGQKAVLTSCTLRSRDAAAREHACCFSFTIRRDRYNIPICIVGNFIPL